MAMEWIGDIVKINLLKALCLLGFGVGLAMTVSTSSTPPQKTIESKFEEIYTILTKMNEYENCLVDTQLRSLHYAKPHTELQKFCIECYDLWGKPDERIVEISTEELKRLRKTSEETIIPEEILSVDEELESIITLLKGHSSFLYMIRNSEEKTYHYMKKHPYDKAGAVDKCPDCIALRKKQTTETTFISKKEYDKLTNDK